MSIVKVHLYCIDALVLRMAIQTFRCFFFDFQGRSPPGIEPDDLPTPYDAQHETTRKEQLLKLFNRTPEQV